MDQLSPLERVQTSDSGTPILLNGTPEPRKTVRSSVRQLLVRLFSSIRRNQPQHTYPRKPSTLGPYPLPQPPREAAPPSREKASPLSRGPIVRFTPDHAASMESGWSKRLPNMLRSVIRNEVSWFGPERKLGFFLTHPFEVILHHSSDLFLCRIRHHRLVSCSVEPPFRSSRLASNQLGRDFLACHEKLRPSHPTPRTREDPPRAFH